jgi:diacylglycerol kinase (ATP)
VNDRPDKRQGAARFARAFGSTWRGFRAAWRDEAAFRQECALALVVVPLGLWLGATGVERALLVGPMFLVLAIELVNSALEATVDRIGLERHPLSGKAKELGSAAVFAGFVVLAVNWLLVVAWPR